MKFTLFYKAIYFSRQLHDKISEFILAFNENKYPGI
jgi:hypothetical protein